LLCVADFVSIGDRTNELNALTDDTERIVDTLDGLGQYWGLCDDVASKQPAEIGCVGICFDSEAEWMFGHDIPSGLSAFVS
jgi:hypothetical protein